MNMVARLFFTALSVVLAVFMMRLVLGGARHARVPVRNDAQKNPRHIARLKQDPSTGVYYPAD
jgi:hypothetical protein